MTWKEQQAAYQPLACTMPDGRVLVRLPVVWAPHLHQQQLLVQTIDKGLAKLVGPKYQAKCMMMPDL